MVGRKKVDTKNGDLEDLKKTKQNVESVEDNGVDFAAEKKEKEETKDDKDNVNQVVDKASVEQCISDIKAQGVTAIKALKKYFEQRGGKSLFPEMDNSANVLVVYKKPALVTSRGRAQIVLPRPFRTFQDSTICLILPDMDQSIKARTDPDVDKQAREWADKIEKDHDLKNKRIKIITKRQLEREYHTYNEKRALATQYDLFMVDCRVGKSVSAFLGKEFVKAHKRPLWFDYFNPLAESISRGLNTVTFPLNRYMTRASVNVGHLGQDTSDISENLNAAIDKIAELCPGGLQNLRSIFLQSSDSEPSIPIFFDDGHSNDVKLKRENKHSRPDQKVDVDECTTLPDGLKLEVRKNGKIRVLRESDNQGVLYPTVNDEWDARDINKPTIDPVKLENKKKIKAKRNAKRASLALQRGIVKKRKVKN